jgi:biopolymer transport protein ExbD
MSRKRNRSWGDEEVQLNLAAMLDMAFQLLAFFILTFRPAPIEGQISLRMPPPQPLASANAKQQAGESHPIDPVQGFNTLSIILTSDETGKLAQIFVAKQEVPVDERSLTLFSDYLGKMLNDPGSPFDQVVIQVPAKLHYYELMRVIGVCTRQTVGGDPHNKLSKLSLVDEKNLDSP